MAQRNAFPTTNRSSIPLMTLVSFIVSLGAGCPALVTEQSRLDLDSLELPTDDLQSRIDLALRSNLAQRELLGEVNAAWQIMHGMLAYGRQLEMTVNGESIGVFDSLFQENPKLAIEGWQLMTGDMLPSTGRRGVRAKLEPGSFIGQGHVDQWLAIAAQCGIELDETVVVDGVEFTIEDWVRQAQYEISENPVKEYSWTMIALMHYLPEETNWECIDGNRWEWDSIVEFEAKQDLIDSPCGGMHRLAGLVKAVEFRQRANQPLNGAWALAKKQIQESIATAKTWQNSDGSFSCNYTARPGVSNELNLSISATGHTFEFLAMALPPGELASPWMEAACRYLCDSLELTKSSDLESGGLYHTLNGLKIYRQRRWPSDALTGQQ